MRGKAIPLLALASLVILPAALPAESADSCFGLPATMTALPGVETDGTPGDDVIIGTEGQDVIRGNGGKDRICGRGGDDRLYGGMGRDRISGGEGNDLISGGGGVEQTLKGDAGKDIIRTDGTRDRVLGGDGNDTLIAHTPATLVGGRGNDTLNSYAGFVSLEGNAGSDHLNSGYRNDVDGGIGYDHCVLDLAVPGTRCEQVALLCGSGGDPLPGGVLSDLSQAAGDFDGNGVDDTLSVWRSGAQWTAHIATDGGFGALLTLPTDQYEPARAVGAHDANGDGLEEAFLLVGTGASAQIVGLYTLWEPFGSPTTGFSCGIAPVTFASSAEAHFAINPGLLHQSGLECLGNRTLREYYQETTDGITYWQDRYHYSYFPNFGIGDPQLGLKGSILDLVLVRPGDDALIDRAGRFTCNGLSL